MTLSEETVRKQLEDKFICTEKLQSGEIIAVFERMFYFPPTQRHFRADKRTVETRIKNSEKYNFDNTENKKALKAINLEESKAGL